MFFIGRTMQASGNRDSLNINNHAFENQDNVHIQLLILSFGEESKYQIHQPYSNYINKRTLGHCV